LTPESGRVVSMDIQQDGLDSAKNLLNKEITDPKIRSRIELIQVSKSTVSEIQILLKRIRWATNK